MLDDVAMLSRERLLGLVAEQAALICELRVTVERLTARVAELERRVGRNSRNSSAPPSADGLSKPPPRSRREESGREPGGQRGHEGTTLCQVEHPDEVVAHSPQRCGGCAASLAVAPVVSVERRQVFDLPPLALRVVEHRIEHRRCRCGITTMADAPAGVGAPAQYGPRVRGVAAYLAGDQHLPVARAVETMADLLGVTVSTGTLAGTVTRTATGLDGFLDALRGQLAAAPVAHFDETGMRVDGRLAWVHSASTERLALFGVHPRRGLAAMDALDVLPGFAGVAVHDGWKPYRSYDCAHALCNAHHLRELDGIAEAPDQDWAERMGRLLVEIHRTVEAGKLLGAEELHPDLLAAYQSRYQTILDEGRVANPPAAGRRQTVARNLLDRLDRHRHDVLRFAADFRVPFDNNQAERDIRMVKLRQKISGGLRTFAGAQAFCAIRSYLATARKHGRNALNVLYELHTGHVWLPGNC